MRLLLAPLVATFRHRSRLRNLSTLGRFLLLNSGLVAVFSILFHLIMEYEDRDHSWLTGVYWTLTTMTTLGFGDITFQSDLGRMFSIVVMLVGVLFFQVLLTFFIIQYLYLPWTEAQARARVPRSVPEDLRDHVILTHDTPLARTVAALLSRESIPYVLLGGPPDEALRRHDEGLVVVPGSFDEPTAYRAAGIARAALVVASGLETANANAVVTAREVAEGIPILADSRSSAADGILRIAGADGILRRGLGLGQALAGLVAGGERAVHAVGAFHGLVIAEVLVSGTGLAGRTLIELGLRPRGLTAAGVRWRDRFLVPTPDLALAPGQVLVVVGPTAAVEAFAAEVRPTVTAKVLILGGGRVARSAAEALACRGIPCRLVERNPAQVRDPARTQVGDASDPTVLEAAGIAQASDILVTTRDDDLNIYLTILARRMAPSARLLARVLHERNISTLHRAGAEVVLSGDTLAAQTIIDRVHPAGVRTLSEGVQLVRETVPAAWAGRTLAELALPQREGLQVIALDLDGTLQIAPGADVVLRAGQDLLGIRARQRPEA